MTPKCFSCYVNFTASARQNWIYFFPFTYISQKFNRIQKKSFWCFCSFSKKALSWQLTNDECYGRRMYERFGAHTTSERSACIHSKNTLIGVRCVGMFEKEERAHKHTANETAAAQVAIYTVYQQIQRTHRRMCMRVCVCVRLSNNICCSFSTAVSYT